MQVIASPTKRTNRKRGEAISKQEQKIAIILRQRAFNAVLCGYAIVLIPILAMLFLQGFHAWGFNLPEKLVYGLAGTVIGEIAGFTYIVLRFLFPRHK